MHKSLLFTHTGESTFIADSRIFMKFPVYDWLKLSFVLIVVSLVVLWYLEFVSQFYCVFIYFYLVRDLCKKTTFFFIIFIFTYVLMYVYTCAVTPMWKSVDSLCVLVLSFHCVGPGQQAPLPAGHPVLTLSSSEILTEDSDIAVIRIDPRGISSLYNELKCQDRPFDILDLMSQLTKELGFCLVRK